MSQSAVRRRLRRVLADDRPGSLAHRARARRWDSLLQTFPDLRSMSVLDMGGTSAYWSQAPVRPSQLTIVNPAPGDEDEVPWVEVVAGDACRPPEQVESRHYDLVYSNSTIEHVGGHARRVEFAATADRLGDRLWIQTPYRYSPVEPHFVFPFFAQLPLPLRALLARKWPLSPAGFPRDPAAALEEIMTIELISGAELAFYFPGAQIRMERIAGIPKSIIAIRTAPPTIEA